MLKSIPWLAYSLVVSALLSPAQAETSPAAAENPAALRALAQQSLMPIPLYSAPPSSGHAALVHLGRSLFKERLLSQQFNLTCANCHRLSQGVGTAKLAALDQGSAGEKALRNTPALLNTSLQRVWNWDGGADSLTQQLRGHLLDARIMGMPDEAAVMKRLNSNPSYEVAFGVAYKDAIAADPSQAPAMSFAHTLDALSAYLGTLYSHDRFDQFLNGDDAALNPSELRGLRQFIDLGCVECHRGPLLGGESHAKLGVKADAGELVDASDLGRYTLSQQEEDKAVFKVPSLRNVALSAPYFHAGQVEHLNQAVSQMARLQLGATLSEQQLRDLVAFLNSLTDQQQL